MIDLRAVWRAFVCITALIAVFVYADFRVTENVVTGNGAVTEKQGFVALHTDGISKRHKAVLMINGDAYCDIDASDKIISVNCGDVIEIDTRRIKKPLNITVEDVSDNVDPSSLKNLVASVGKIDMIGRIKLDNI